MVAMCAGLGICSKSRAVCTVDLLPIVLPSHGKCWRFSQRNDFESMSSVHDDGARKGVVKDPRIRNNIHHSTFVIDCSIHPTFLARVSSIDYVVTQWFNRTKRNPKPRLRNRGMRLMYNCG